MTRSTNALLRGESLRVRLGQRDVVDSVDVDVGPGWTALVGPNGAGKSTLLRALAGLAPLAGGRVTLHGRGMATMRPAERGRALAWLAQQDEPAGDLNVQETVALGRIPHHGLMGVAGEADQAAIERAMALTGCAPWRNRRLLELSGGERQRVLLARVLATEASVMLLDEPTTHLDAPHQVALARLLRGVANDTDPRDGRARHAIVTVLHDLSIALRADRLLVMQAARLRADGAPGDAHVRAAIEDVFDGAVRVQRDAAGRLLAVLSLDDAGPAQTSSQWPATLSRNNPGEPADGHR